MCGCDNSEPKSDFFLYKCTFFVDSNDKLNECTHNKHTTCLISMYICVKRDPSSVPVTHEREYMNGINEPMNGIASIALYKSTHTISSKYNNFLILKQTNSLRIQISRC